MESDLVFGNANESAWVDVHFLLGVFVEQPVHHRAVARGMIGMQLPGESMLNEDVIDGPGGVFFPHRCRGDYGRDVTVFVGVDGYVHGGNWGEGRSGLPRLDETTQSGYGLQIRLFLRAGAPTCDVGRPG